MAEAQRNARATEVARVRRDDQPDRDPERGRVDEEQAERGDRLDPADRPRDAEHERELDDEQEEEVVRGEVDATVRCDWTTAATPAVRSRPANIQTNAWVRNAVWSRASGLTPSDDGVAYGAGGRLR